MEKFSQKKNDWVANKQKNQLTSHLWDDAVILVSNFCCAVSVVENMSMIFKEPFYSTVSAS